MLISLKIGVALRKESVDRNCFYSSGLSRVDTVALRKESVDRNGLCEGAFLLKKMSLSARRAWIEMHCVEEVSGDTWTVALRKESVDRNIRVDKTQSAPRSRSPQGERG